MTILGNKSANVFCDTKEVVNFKDTVWSSSSFFISFIVVVYSAPVCNEKSLYKHRDIHGI